MKLCIATSQWAWWQGKIMEVRLMSSRLIISWRCGSQVICLAFSERHLTKSLFEQKFSTAFEKNRLTHSTDSDLRSTHRELVLIKAIQDIWQWVGSHPASYWSDCCEWHNSTAVHSPNMQNVQDHTHHITSHQHHGQHRTGQGCVKNVMKIKWISVWTTSL